MTTLEFVNCLSTTCEFCVIAGLQDRQRHLRSARHGRRREGPGHRRQRIQRPREHRPNVREL